MSQSLITTKEEMLKQFDHMRDLTRSNPINDWKTREAHLDSLEAMLSAYKQNFADAINEDFGQRSQVETDFAELFPSFQGIAHAKKHGKSWMKTRRVGISPLYMPARNELQPQPLGLVGIMVPWNYPIFLSVGPIIDALTAGNRIMIKMSEVAPKLAQVFGDAVAEFFSSDVISVVLGEIELSSAFSELPFDHLLFTGSTSVGKKIMAAAAPNLTPVTLELGGKSPVIVLDDAELGHVVNRVMMGKTLNAGQTCIAPDYVILNKARHAEFASLARKWVKKHYPNLDNNKDYTRMINERQFNRVQGYLNAQPEDKVIALTDIPADAKTQFMPPTIVADPDPASDIMQEELFAPILPLVHADHLTAAVDFVNARPRPLALYIFGDDQDDISYVRDHTVSGGVSVNDVILHVVQNDLPFGGVGASGTGAYHGKMGFERLSHIKPVFNQSKLNAMALTLPPYTNIFKKGLALLSK